MVKNWYRQFGHGTIKLMEWTDFCMLVQIQESEKLFYWFLSGRCQKLVYPSLENECMNWADFLHADCDAIFFG